MQGSTDQITLLGEELHHPYDKPPLSKEMLAREQGAPGADPGPGPVALLTEDELAALDVDLQLGVRATRLDPAARVVETEHNGTFGYNQLVIATGVVPRALPGPVPAGVHTIRTADDALALRTALARTPDVVVVGAGFIGAEFASAARASIRQRRAASSPAPRSPTRNSARGAHRAPSISGRSSRIPIR